MDSGTSDKGFIHLAPRGVVHVLPALLQGVETFHPGVVAVSLQPVVAQVDTGQCLAVVGSHVIQAAQWGEGLRVLVLQQQQEAHGRLLAPPGSLSHLWEQVALADHQSPFCSLADVRGLAENIQLILDEEPGVVAELAVHDGAEATGAAVLILIGGVGDVQPHISALDVHVAGADAAAVKVPVLEDVEHGVREDEGHVQAVRLWDGLHRARLHRVERPRGGGGGGGGALVRAVVLDGALAAGGAPASGSPGRARRARRGHREARRGRGRQHPCAAVAGRGRAVEHHRRAHLGRAHLQVVLVRQAAHAGHVAAGKGWEQRPVLSELIFKYKEIVEPEGFHWNCSKERSGHNLDLLLSTELRILTTSTIVSYNCDKKYYFTLLKIILMA